MNHAYIVPSIPRPSIYHRELPASDLEVKMAEWLDIEWEKVKASPSYFYHNYFFVNGRRPRREMSDEEFDKLIAKYRSGKTIATFRGRGGKIRHMALKED